MAGHHAVEEDQFFDARDEIASVSDLGSDCSEDGCFCSGLPNFVVNSIGYDFWVKTPESAHLRRSRLLKWMGLISNQNRVEKEDSDCILSDEINMGIDRISEHSGSVPRNLNLNDCFLPSCSSVSRCSTEEAELLGDNSSEENFLCKINNLDDGKQFVVDEARSNGLLSRLREVGSNRLVTTEEFQRIFSSSSQRSLCREAEADNLGEVKSKVKSGWLRKLSVIGHIVGRQGETKLKPSSFNSEGGPRIPRVQVHSHRKRSKELSSLYVEQEFAAHEGSILTMKFSPDGQYLASAGEDGIVRVWKVIEDDKPNKLDSQPIDPSCLYLSRNHVSKLVSLGVNKDKIGKTKRLKKSSESACVIFPSKVFQIIEEPLHEFHGHGGEVLALSWSKNGVSIF